MDGLLFKILCGLLLQPCVLGSTDVRQLPLSIQQHTPVKPHAHVDMEVQRELRNSAIEAAAFALGVTVQAPIQESNYYNYSWMSPGPNLSYLPALCHKVGGRTATAGADFLAVAHHCSRLGNICKALLNLNCNTGDGAEWLFCSLSPKFMAGQSWRQDDVNHCTYEITGHIPGLASLVELEGSRGRSQALVTYLDMSVQHGNGSCADNIGNGFDSWYGTPHSYASCQHQCSSLQSCIGFDFRVKEEFCEIRFSDGDLPSENPGPFSGSFGDAVGAGAITQVNPAYAELELKCYKKMHTSALLQEEERKMQESVENKELDAPRLTTIMRRHRRDGVGSSDKRMRRYTRGGGAASLTEGASLPWQALPITCESDANFKRLATFNFTPSSDPAGQFRAMVIPNGKGSIYGVAEFCIHGDFATSDQNKDNAITKQEFINGILLQHPRAISSTLGAAFDKAASGSATLNEESFANARACACFTQDAAQGHGDIIGYITPDGVLVSNPVAAARFRDGRFLTKEGEIVKEAIGGTHIAAHNGEATSEAPTDAPTKAPM
jgi:hypothetical protein